MIMASQHVRRPFRPIGGAEARQSRVCARCGGRGLSLVRLGRCSVSWLAGLRARAGCLGSGFLRSAGCAARPAERYG